MSGDYVDGVTEPVLSGPELGAAVGVEGVMIRRIARTGVVFLSATAVLLTCAGAAYAIPWDVGGKVPPSETPAPEFPDPLCQQSYADDLPEPGSRIHFGIGPRLAGEIGTGQATPLVPENWRKRDQALRKLAGSRDFSVRLNRLFMSDGWSGIRRFQKMARHYGRLGFGVELQVRYHPKPKQDGDIKAWLQYVRNVVRAFGPIRAVKSLQITNEVNLAISPNTSDGAWKHARRALVSGVKTAQRYSNRLGYGRLKIGFNFAWRFGAQADADFWDDLTRIGGKSLRRATDWIGLDLYPGTYLPPRAAISDYGDAFLEALAQMRECYMPKAGFGSRFPLKIEETGWPTGPGRTEAEQKEILRQFVTTAHLYRGTYGITDFRWFGLRDNNSAGEDYQSYFGLLRDDYSPKPAFGEYRRLLARYGAGKKANDNR
ncbi:MAG: hypothetical protein KDB54_01305 [Solirubrobacterales bacterium]|nr:hypothetical protein [Solirubrobacterales bacterium]HRV59699.1 hypothetical protein [Solirubrobacterales bacterium]